jgi:hypothetical protein
MQEGNGFHSLLILKTETADCGQFTCLAENVAGEARSTADLVVRPSGSEAGHYFHITKVSRGLRHIKINGRFSGDTGETGQGRGGHSQPSVLNRRASGYAACLLGTGIIVYSPIPYHILAYSH